MKCSVYRPIHVYLDSLTPLNGFLKIAFEYAAGLPCLKEEFTVKLKYLT